MLRLILDRSGGCAGFALADEAQVICKTLWTGGAMHSPAWFAEMAAEIQSSGCSVADIDQFICGTGPGSFSGIRAALSALEGMALPGRKAVLGISGAAVLAFEYGVDDFDLVTVIGDARRSRLWCVSYKLDNSGCGIKLLNGAEISNTASDFELITTEDLLKKIPAGSRIISPDWDRIGELLTETFPDEYLIKQKLSPDIEIMARLVAQAPALCRLEPMPIYLHPAVAVKRVTSKG